jgi:hypothetical protein
MSKNASFRVSNESSQAERRATLQNDRRVHKNTYFSHTHPDEGGRFAVACTGAGERKLRLPAQRLALRCAEAEIDEPSLAS